MYVCMYVCMYIYEWPNMTSRYFFLYSLDLGQSCFMCLKTLKLCFIDVCPSDNSETPRTGFTCLKSRRDSTLPRTPPHTHARVHTHTHTHTHTHITLPYSCPDISFIPTVSLSRPSLFLAPLKQGRALIWVSLLTRCLVHLHLPA